LFGEDARLVEQVRGGNQLLRRAALDFFFQAEDGIRHRHVTGVQTCALPISFFLLVVLSMALLLVFALFKESLFAWFNMQALVPWWFLVVLGASGAAFYELLSLWATRRKQYKIGRASCRESVWVWGLAGEGVR